MIRPLRHLVPALGLVAASFVALPTQAQEGVLMKQILGNIGLIPDEKDPIEYRDRPGLVVPKDLGKLPAPEANGAKGDPRWPNDPDVAAREAARRQRENPVFLAPGVDPLNGARLSPQELAKARTARDASNYDPQGYTDKAGVRLSVQEMTAAHKVMTEPSYPPGTEPPRKYLTDPPAGSRMPSSAAPAGKASVEGRVINDDRPKDAWRRLD